VQAVNRFHVLVVFSFVFFVDVHYSWLSYKIMINVECVLMPNVMAERPNIGGALCERSIILFLVPCHKVWLMAAVPVPCSNTANIRECKTWRQSDRGQEPPKMYI